METRAYRYVIVGAGLAGVSRRRPSASETTAAQSCSSARRSSFLMTARL